MTSLLERQGELARLRVLLDAAREGHGSLLLVEGPPGIGKSAVLRRAVELAEEDVTILRARGTELEQQYPFGVAIQLADPLVAAASRERRDALFEGAAGFVRSLFDADVGVGPSVQDAGFRTLHGLYWLVANLAYERPLLLLVDDAQWADDASLRFLAFLAGRLEGLPVLLVVAYRRGDAGAAHDALASLADDPVVEAMRLPPLSRDALRELIRQTFAQEPDDAFVAACERAAGGNPFLTGELLAELARNSARPTAERAEELEDVTSPALARSVLGRVARLGAAAQALARACAVLGDGTELQRAAALSGLEVATAAHTADALAAIGIFEPDARLSFSHPLVRAAVYCDIPRHARAAAHAAAAHLLAAVDAPVAQVATHLLLTDPAGDSSVVARLAQAARNSAAHGAPETAVAYLRRALAEPPPAAERSPLLTALGVAELAIGDLSATDHLREALELTEGPERAAPARALAAALVFTDRAAEAVDLLAGEIDRAGVDREVRLCLEAELVAAAEISGVHTRDIDRRLAAYRGELSGGTAGERMLLAVSGYHGMLAGEDPEESLAMVRRALAGGAGVADQSADSPVPGMATAVLINFGGNEEAEQAIGWVMAEARLRGSPLGIALATTLQTHLHLMRGRVREAESVGVAALDLAHAARWLGGVAWLTGLVTWAMTERRELAAAEDLLERHGVAGELPPRFFFDLLLCARAHLHLARGRFAEAVSDALSVARHQEATGRNLQDPLLDWGSPAVLAQLALGRAGVAREIADERLAAARRVGVARPLAVALRLHAVTEGDPERVVERLRAVLPTIAGADAPLVQARALVDLGRTLRRLKRPTGAREPLREALAVAERVGAKLVAETARSELEATGERRRKTQALAGLEALTPSERRVASLAAEGMSNKEIAQTLFVTLKTVEIHLTQTYRKLGLSSRRELPDAL